MNWLKRPGLWLLAAGMLLSWVTARADETRIAVAAEAAHAEGQVSKVAARAPHILIFDPTESHPNPVANPSGAGPALARWLKRSLGKDLAATVPPERVADVRCVLTRIVDNRYRWGSCTPSESVTFNWRLIKAPMFVIDYLIVHELAHLIERNHSPEFWSIVRAKMPTMEKAKAWLREHRQMLEQEI